MCIRDRCNIDSFKIDLKALPQGITEKDCKLTNEYFEAIDAPVSYTHLVEHTKALRDSWLRN